MIQIDSDTVLPAIDINFKVLAGPGAGKTHWLVEHLKNVLANSKRLGKVGKISCITFTNIGVETIRSRLGQSADQVEVSSIHSFLYRHVVRPYLSFVAQDYQIDVQKIDGHTDTILSGYSFLQRWKTQTDQARITDDDAIKNALKNMRWKFTDKGELEVNTSYPHKVNGYAIKKTSYFEYKKLAWQDGVLHHDDVLFFSYIIFERFPFLINVLAAKFPYIFIDEFQDCNPIQVELLYLLGNYGIFLGVIGDVAQSIYGFQGAATKQLKDFQLADMISYVMSDNRRSSNQIVHLLNTVRVDIVQKPHRGCDMDQPIIYVGSMDLAHTAAKLKCDPEIVHSLSRDNITSNIMKRELTAGSYDSELMKLLRDADSNGLRRGFVIASIKSIELARQKNFKEAIKELRRGMRKFPDTLQNDKKAIQIILNLLRDYPTYCTMSLLDYSNYIRSNFFDGAAKVTSGKAKTFYEQRTYQELALCVQIREDLSLHRTIHKAKGDEFDNVLVLLSDSSKFDFFLAPDLLSDTSKSEEQRVNYVAISRAKNRLFISVPELSDNDRSNLQQAFDIVDV